MPGLTIITRWTMTGAAAMAVLVIAAGQMTGAPAVAQGVGDTSGSGHGTASSETGKAVYGEICQACHMPNAEGGMGAGAIPALAKNPHLADPDWMVSTVLKGRGGMPAFAEMLSPEQIAGVTTYVRTHFGNDYQKPVTVDDVKRLSRGLGGEE